MCSKNRVVDAFWPHCGKDFAINGVHAFNKIFGRKPKSCDCNNDRTEHFNSPFALKIATPPAWITHYKQVLRFYAYFQEPIPESRLETYRVHHVHILFHLEDGTLSIQEPATYDPGFPQGKFLGRHKVRLPEPCHESFLTLDHIRVGCPLEIYGKTFYITGCDDFTRKFLNRTGVPVPANVEPPCDIATEKRKEELVHTFMTRRTGIQGCRLVEKGVKYLTNTRCVLRFWGYWDDRCNDFGRLRRFVFLFHLEDDTVEIMEIVDGEQGIGANPVFLRRQKLLKNFEDLVHLPGFTEEGFDVLNTSSVYDECGELGVGYLTDRLYTGHHLREYYKAQDLAIGATLNVYGRAFILTEADEFTKAYYRDKFGVQDFTPLVLDENRCGGAKQHVQPSCDFQLEEQEKSIDNLGQKDTEPRTHDFMNMVMDRDILAFSALMPCAQHKVNSERRFLIKYFMVDSSFQIFEHAHPNSGIKSGTFMARLRVKKPKLLQDHTGPCGPCSEYYLPSDMYIGNTLEINGFKFLLMSAEECTLSYMEKHYNLFPQSNLCQILNKVREAFGPHPADCILSVFSGNDTEKKGVMSTADFRCLILDFTKASLNEHEIKTLIRAYRVTHPRIPPDLETLRSIFHTELKRYGFGLYSLQRLEYNFRHYDTCHTGFVDRTLLRQVLKGARIPVRRELLDFLVQHFPDPCCEQVNYCDVMKFLDWENYEIPLARPAAVACILRHLCPQPPPDIDCVNYHEFLDQVCPNIRCSLAALCNPCPPPVVQEYLNCLEEAQGNCAEDQGQGCQGSGSPEQSSAGTGDCQGQSQENPHQGQENHEGGDAVDEEELHKFYDNNHVHD